MLTHICVTRPQWVKISVRNSCCNLLLCLLFVSLFLTHWGRVTYICIGKLTIIDSDNGLSPGRRQAIIWTSAGILLIGPLGTNFNEILIGIQTFSFKKMQLKILSAKWHPYCLGLNVLSIVGIAFLVYTVYHIHIWQVSNLERYYFFASQPCLSWFYSVDEFSSSVVVRLLSK